MTETHFRIRTATTFDAEKIASVNVTAWHETYTDILPPATLAGVTLAARTERWKNILDSFDDVNRHVTFLAETKNVAIGYVSIGNQRDKFLMDQKFSAEVTSIYVVAKAHRKGLGRALLRKASIHIHNSGHRAMSLWVLDTNHNARRFYEALGGQLVSEREDIRPEGTLNEVAYGWSDISPLLE